jgi:hypothetical protein
MEILTQNETLTSKLRMPAVSRLQKVHNIDLALTALKSARCGKVNLSQKDGPLTNSP